MTIKGNSPAAREAAEPASGSCNPRKPLALALALGAFDWGAGDTDLDCYIRRVIDSSRGADYARRWSVGEWLAARECSKLVDFYGCMPKIHGVIPVWLAEAAQGHMNITLDVPAPTLFTTWTEHIDWFELHNLHPEECCLQIPFDPGPTIEQVRDAVAAIKTTGGIPVLRAAVHPRATLDGVDVELETLAGVWPSATAAATASAIAAANEVGQQIGGVTGDRAEITGYGSVKRVAPFADFCRKTAYYWEWAARWPSVQELTREPSHDQRKGRNNA